jgi:hypothetical protein
VRTTGCIARHGSRNLDARRDFETLRLSRIDHIEMRLDRIERRLGLIDA